MPPDQLDELKNSVDPMFDSSKHPLYADFNGADEDGAVWMSGNWLDMRLQKTDFVPKEGAKVWISDGDVEETGTLAFRENRYWVSITDKGSTKNVPKDAWYHNDNLHKET
jgi:hypothetical protein